MDTYDIGMKKTGSKVQTLLLGKKIKGEGNGEKLKGKVMSRNSTLLLFKMKEERVWWCADENDLASCKTEGMELEQSGGCGIS